MKTGKVKFFDVTKGYGFIVDDESKNELFVHATSVQEESKPLKKDDKVSFDTKQGNKGMMAIDVAKI